MGNGMYDVNGIWDGNGIWDKNSMGWDGMRWDGIWDLLGAHCLSDVFVCYGIWVLVWDVGHDQVFYSLFA